MKKAVRTILFALTALLLFLPMAQEQFGLFQFKKLHGVVAEKKKPKLNLENYRNQTFQQWTESHLKLHHGMREPLTRMYNQYLWDVFGESNITRDGQVYISDDGWFYERPSVREYYSGRLNGNDQERKESVKHLGEEALRIYRIQKILEESGTHLFVMLLPGKEMIYPEHIPHTDDFPEEKTFSARDFYKQRFERLGVNCFDVGDWFLRMKDTVDYPLYPQTGTHWSNYAAMHVADSLIRYMEHLGDMSLTHFTIGERREETVYPDDDLEQLLNLMRPLPKAPNYYADCNVIPDSTAQKPTVITIGDSYFWNIFNATPFGEIMGNIPFWYYFNTIFFDNYHHNTKEVDVLKQVVDADFVILAYSTHTVYKMGAEFTEPLLNSLCYNEAELAAAYETCAKYIWKDKEWMANLESKAQKEVITVDSAVTRAAYRYVASYPHKYIPSPAPIDSVPSSRSDKFLQYTEEKMLNLTENGHGIQ